MQFLARTTVAAFGFWLASRFVAGIACDGTGWLVGAALLLGVVNAVVRPVLILLTLPVTILTLGLFILVINAGTFGLVAWLLGGLHVAGFMPALLGSLVVSVTGWIGNLFFHKD